MGDIKLSKEQFIKAAECKTAEELMTYCKELGYEIPLEDAEKFIAQVSEQELTVDEVENIAGGLCGAAISVACLGPGVA